MTNPADQPVSEYAKAVKNLIEIAQELGLQVHACGIVPPLDDTPVVLQVSFVREETPVPQDSEQLEFDRKFKEQLMGEQEGIEERARRELEEFFKDDDGN